MSLNSNDTITHSAMFSLFLITNFNLSKTFMYSLWLKKIIHSSCTGSNLQAVVTISKYHEKLLQLYMTALENSSKFRNIFAWGSWHPSTGTARRHSNGLYHPSSSRPSATSWSAKRSDGQTHPPLMPRPSLRDNSRGNHPSTNTTG
jgi:hypothetical protein